MNCEYCNKEMPASYSYEVGGTVECRECFNKRTTTPEENLRALVKAYQMEIADLDQQLAEMKRAIQWSYDEGDCSVLNKWIDE